MKRLFHFFIDGLGLGDDSGSNPVKDCFSHIMGGNLLLRRPDPLFFPGGVMIPADPIQGVPGIPQSATGQTSLLTGENAQALLGLHLTAFPNEKLVELIQQKSLLKLLRENGVSVTSANLYTPEFFEQRGRRRKNMFPVSTLSIRAAGIPFRFPPDYSNKRALFADITNRLIRERGYKVPLISPEEGAVRIMNILEDYQAVFFEYFMTDLLGHKRNGPELRARAGELDRFLHSLVRMTRNREDFLILVCSDHGNAEDNERGDHTLNDVPVLLITPDRSLQEKAAESIHQLTDVYRFVLDYFLDRETGNAQN